MSRRRNRRIQFHEILVSLLGSENVYFQPPSTMKIKYPCIIYNRNTEFMRHADDGRYADRTCYMVYVIDPDPDSDIPEKVGYLPLASFDKHYTAENLNHDVYSVYY